MQLADAQLKPLGEAVKDAVDEFCFHRYEEQRRKHLGASILGHECARYLWYDFRWAKREIFSARMKRLFNRGHNTEARFIEWLRGIGFDVYDVDPSTGDQWRIGGVMGHFGGSLDAIIVGTDKLPEPLAPLRGMSLLGEFKTHNSGYFGGLLKDGVVVKMPKHYAQMCSYGKAYNLEYALYCAINKNDDDLKFEIVKLDWSLAGDYWRKAEDIVTANFPPPKVAQQKEYYQCKMCRYAEICHGHEAIEINCRSCENARPIDGGNWHCALYGQIPPEYIAQGCGNHRPIGR